MSNHSKKLNTGYFDYLDILIALGKMGGIRRLVTCTTAELGALLGISQQTASRKLVEMENRHLIIRKYSQRGNSIKITQEGISNLEQVFTDMWMILTTSGRKISDEISLKGTVITGMAEGAYYMGKRPYQDQITMILGFSPFPGTLNLQILDEETLNNFERLLRVPAKFISGFKEADRVFGKVFLWPSYLIINKKRIPSAIIRPDRTHHTNQIELIAHENIKKTYKVKDGDELTVILR
ncbi:MAG: CTP-dependent riboflavin kinase [Candidatus Heimdallarchaeota archaeon]|nr:CTP-dependent riboflavin kinase [Candidatus Heimdallarchaeota archaeon]